MMVAISFDCMEALRRLRMLPGVSLKRPSILFATKCNNLKIFQMEENAIIQTLNVSVGEALKRNQDGYRAIYALLITWEERDDPGIALEVERFENFLIESVGAIVTPYQIPSQDPQIELQETLSGFISKNRHTAEESLFLIYYSGHGDKGGSEKRSIWTA